MRIPENTICHPQEARRRSPGQFSNRPAESTAGPVSAPEGREAGRFLAKPFGALAGGPSGPWSVRFKGASEDPSPEEVKRLTEAFADVHSANRLAALFRLHEIGKFPDETLARTVARYLYFNESLSNNFRRPARWLNIELSEKTRSPWSAYGLMVNAAEISSPELARYSTAVLHRVYPQLPKWVQTRIRTQMYDSLSGLRGMASSRDANFSAFLAENAPKEDLSYLWFLIRESSLRMDGQVSIGLSKIVGRVLAREYGLGIQPVLLETCKTLFNNEQMPGRRADTVLGLKTTDIRNLAVILMEMPGHINDLSPERLAAVDYKTRKDTLYSLVDTLTFLAPNWDRFYSAFTPENRQKTGEVISRLMKDLGPEDKTAFKVYLKEALDKDINQPELLANLVELLQDGAFTYGEVQASFINPLLTDDRRYTPYPVRDTGAARRLLAAKLNPVRDRDGLLNLYKLKEKTNAVFRTSTYIPARISPVKDVAWYLQGDNIEALPREFKAGNPAGRRLERPVGLLSPSPEEKSSGSWELEPLSPSKDPQNITLLTNRLRQSIQREERSKIRPVLEKLTMEWLANQSQEAYQAISENLPNRLVREVFLSHLNKLQYSAEGHGRFFVHTSEAGGKRVAIPHKQVLSLVKQILELEDGQDRFAAQNIEKTLRYVLLQNPEGRTDILNITLNHFERMAPGSPGEEYTAKALFTMLTMGTPIWMLEQHSGLLKRMLRLTSASLATSSRAGVDASQLFTSGWESSDADEASPQVKHGFDTFMDLAVKLKDTPSIERGLDWLNEYNLRIRNTSYSDKLFIIRYLRNPEIAKVALQTENMDRFVAFTEMVGWFKVFEVIPEMIRFAVDAPLARQVNIQSAIATGVELYALPELKDIAQNGRNRREREFAKRTLDELYLPKTVNTLFRPLPYAFPEELQEKLETLRPGYRPKADAQDKPRSSAGPARRIDELRAKGRISIPGAEKYLAPDPSGEGSEKTPEGRPNDPKSAPMATTNGRVRILGLNRDGEPEDEGEEGASFLAQIRNAYILLTSTRDDDIRLTALNRMLALSQQFKALGQSANGGVAFITPAKTELARSIGQHILRLRGVRDVPEQFALLEVLKDLQDPQSVEPLLALLRDPEQQRLHSTALQVFGELGVSDEQAVAVKSLVRAMLNNPEYDREQANVAKALTRLNDGEGLVAALESGNLSPEAKNTVYAGLGDVVVGDGELERRARAVLLSALSEARQNSKAKENIISALGKIAERDDAEMASKIIAVVGGGDGLQIKLEALRALQYIAPSPEIRQFFNRMNSDSAPAVRAEVQRLLARDAAS